jgi:hypothetical protein
MSTSDSIFGKVWITPELFEMGRIKFNSDNVIVELVSGKILTSNNSDIFFETINKITLNEIGKSVSEEIDSPINIQVKPVLMIRHSYVNQGGQLIEDVFPPSTDGFYGRLQAGKYEALYVVQPIRNSERFWLTITNPRTGVIYENQIIQPYEAEALSLVEDRIRRTMYSKSSINNEENRAKILSILDAPSPSWQELTGIIQDISIPNLKLGNTIRATFSQIVPVSFPMHIREELMAFLAYVVKSKIPNEDPVTYLYKFSSMIILEDLLSNHLMHMLDGTRWPPYVKLMILAERGQLETPKRAVSDWVMGSPWLILSQKCNEMRPNWLNIAVNSAKSLNESNRIVIGLPTTKSAAKKSETLWKKRFAEITYGLRMRGNVVSSSLGLDELVYLGAAYRWPHKHMKFISRLGGINESSPHLQVMLMPPSAVERVKRALPSILSVRWSARTSNYDLFNQKTNKWQVPINRIIDSVDEKSSIRKLMNEFGKDEVPNLYAISRVEAKVADLVSEGVESFYLEIFEFLSNLNLSRRLIKTTITNLVKHKVMKLSYDVSDPSLISLAVIVQGKNDSVTSLFSAFLKYVPSSFVRLNETGDRGVILSRLPEESVYDLASQLTFRGAENDLSIRCLRPTTFQRYTSNLYQRLLKNDGTWDDNVSAFLSQARSKRRELSESNA